MLMFLFGIQMEHIVQNHSFFVTKEFLDEEINLYFYILFVL